MAFGRFRSDEGARPMAEINMTPLIDVMLVLVVIFIVTAPLLTHAVHLDLPRAASTPAPAVPPAVTLSIDAAGRLYWNDRPISAAQLRALLERAGRAAPPPELRLRADQSTRYQQIAAVMAAAQQAGLSRIGFITQPPQP